MKVKFFTKQATTLQPAGAQCTAKKSAFVRVFPRNMFATTSADFIILKNALKRAKNLKKNEKKKLQFFFCNIEESYPRIPTNVI
jgi:hypothetical protein